MEDEESAMHNACADLVSLKKWEAFPMRLLCNYPPGEWIGVRESGLQVGVSVDYLAPELFVTWLPDPKSQDGYVVILFYDDDSKWSLTAHYNRARLPGSESPDLAKQPNGIARPVTTVPISQQVGPGRTPGI
jgi:hypothetical protein